MTTLLALYALTSQQSPERELVESAWIKVQAVAKLLESRDDGSSQLWRSSDRSKLQITGQGDDVWLNAGHVLRAIVRKNGQVGMVSTSLAFAQVRPIPVEFRAGVSSEVAVEVARQVYATLDDRTTLKVQLIVDAGDSWHITAFPQTEPLPLGEGYECVFHIYKYKGLLDVAYLNYVPDLSAAQSSLVSDSVLRAAALDAYQRWKPFDRGEIKGVKTVLLRPHYGEPHETTEEHLALARADKVIPTFDMMIADADTIDPETGNYSRFQVVHVDARTGTALAIEPSELMGTGISNPLPIRPDLKCRSSLSVNGKSLQNVFLNKTYRDHSHSRWAHGTNVFLQGKYAWKCRTSQDGKVVQVGDLSYSIDSQTSAKLKKLVTLKQKPFAAEGSKIKK